MLVGDPLTDCGERARTGQDRCLAHGKDHRQLVAHPAASLRVRHRPEQSQQLWPARQLRRGQGLWAQTASAGVVRGVVVSVRTSIQAPVAVPVTHATPLITAQNRRSQPHSPTLRRPWVGCQALLTRSRVTALPAEQPSVRSFSKWKIGGRRPGPRPCPGAAPSGRTWAGTARRSFDTDSSATMQIAGRNCRPFSQSWTPNRAAVVPPVDSV